MVAMTAISSQQGTVGSLLCIAFITKNMIMLLSKIREITSQDYYSGFFQKIERLLHKIIRVSFKKQRDYFTRLFGFLSEIIEISLQRILVGSFIKDRVSYYSSLGNYRDFIIRVISGGAFGAHNKRLFTYNIIVWLSRRLERFHYKGYLRGRLRRP